MSNEDYEERIKNLLFYIKYNPECNEEYKDELLLLNKNKTVSTMINIFKKDMENFDYDDNNDLTYIFALLDMLPIISNNTYLDNLIANNFNDIHHRITDIIHIKPSNANKNQEGRYRLILNILNKMEETSLKIFYYIPKDYDCNQEEYLDYLIFKNKNIDFIKEAINKFPYIVNNIDNKGNRLIFKILNNYLNSLDIYLSSINLGPIDDLIYYLNVFKLFYNSDKIALSDKDKKDMLKTLKTYIDNKDYKANRLNEKLTYFTNQIFFIITGNDNNNTLSDLNYKYEVHDRFKEAQESDAKRIYICNNDLISKNKRNIYTFDGEDACEIDDGLSITRENGYYRLGIHIANPNRYIKESSILDNEARRRTRSLYLKDEVIPMYPLLLSKDLMGISDKKNSYVMSFYYDIDELTGELINFEIKDEIIRAKKNLTYNNFNNDIIHGSDDIEYYDTLVNLCNISKILEKSYSETDTYKSLHNDDNISLGTKVVADAMIYNNHYVAKYFQEHDLPYIYRCHKVNQNIIKEIEGLEEKIKLRNNSKPIIKELDMIKNIYPKAYYSSVNVGHDGLRVDAYSHVTSPLRRYADVIALRCIVKFYLNKFNNEDKKIYQEYIDTLCDEINSKRRSLDEYEAEANVRKNSIR